MKREYKTKEKQGNFMLQLHFVYAPHWREETGFLLWKKLAKLRQVVRNPMFIGMEGLTPRAKRENNEQIDTLMRELAKLERKVGTAPTNLEVMAPDKEALRKYIESQVSREAKNRAQKMHVIGVKRIADLFNIPCHYLEYAGKTRIKKLEKLANTRTKDAETAEEAINQHKRLFFTQSDVNLAKLGITVKNLHKLAKRYENDFNLDFETQTGHAIILLGGQHDGEEEQIVTKLRELGTAAKVATTERKTSPQLIFEELKRQRTKNPKIKISDEEFAQSTLHTMLLEEERARLKQEAAANGETKDIGDIAENPKFQEITLTTKNAIKKLTGQECKTWIAKLLNGTVKLQDFLYLHS